MEPAGIAIIAGFFILLLVCVMIDKNNGKKFAGETAERYPVKDSFENAFVTENGELLFYLPSGTLPGYKKWNLQDIRYISTFKGEFSLEDQDKNSMCGEYLTPSKKKFLKEKKYRSFYVGISKVDHYVAFIQKHGAHIQHISGGK